MELTINEALQRAVAAHKVGDLDVAERFYRAILKVQARHPDANHNLGVLTAHVRGFTEALPLFEVAFKANPGFEQFWVSYVDALIRSQNIANAESVFDEGLQRGFSLEAINKCREQLSACRANNKEDATTASPSPKDYEREEGPKIRGLPNQISSAAPDQLANLTRLFIERYEMRQYAEALELAATLTKLFENHSFGWIALGVALQKLTRFSEAVDAHRKAVDLSPEDAHCHANLGVAYEAMGRLSEAESCYLQAIGLQSNIPSVHYNLGNTLYALNRVAEAEHYFRQATVLDPDYAEAHSNLGATLKHQNRLDDAEQCYRKAIELKPEYADAFCNLGALLTEQHRLWEAESSLRKAIALRPSYAIAHYNLGNTLKAQGKAESAEECFRRAIALMWNLPNAHNNLGNTLRDLGRFDEAIACYEDAIALDSKFVAAHRHLSLIRKFESRDDRYEQLQALYSDKSLSLSERSQVNFGLAKAHEDLGELELAFTHYEEGNSIRKCLLSYEPADDVRLFEKIRSKHLLIQPIQIESVEAHNTLRPIFIVGMPRSGTTLVEQIISSHSAVLGAGELPFVEHFGAQLAHGPATVDDAALLRFRSAYLSALREYSYGYSIATDKMPQNFRFLGLLAAAFPDAEIIHVKRDAAAVCWANYTKYFATDRLSYCYSIGDIVKYYRLYEALMDFWKCSIGDRIYELDYERLVVNQEAETRSLVQHLGLKWEAQCLRPEDNERSVATASSNQVRQKVYSGGSRAWRKFAPFLKGALDNL